ncbi:MAG TPA: hypothetical protein VFJ16_31310 [Longimicrobium sp.]|nr:hypothetical protein [Longimicrobium sp.]
MAAYLRRDRPNEGYRIWPTLPRPFGRVGPWQTGTKNKRTAEAMENYVVEMAVTRPDVVECLVRGEFDLRELWIAKAQSSARVDRVGDLVLNSKDPMLSEAAERYAKVAKDGRVRDALPRLSVLAREVNEGRAGGGPAAREPRLSWLLEPANVTDLYQAAMDAGQSEASVYRSIHRAVSELVRYHFGKARVRDLMDDVETPDQTTRREVRVSADEIQRLLSEFDDEFRDIVSLAILLAVDRGPLLRVAPRFFNEQEGTLEVLDSKTAHRGRVVVLPAAAVAILRRLCAGRRADDRVFDWTPSAFRHRWEAGRDRAAGDQKRERGRRREARRAAGTNIVTLPDLRFKDLRHLLPTALNALKVPRAEIERVLGHAPGSTVTSRYITPVGARENMDAAAARLGLDRLHLKVG